MVCDREEEGTASVGAEVCFDGDEEGGETSITFSTSGNSDSLLPGKKIKNIN